MRRLRALVLLVLAVPALTGCSIGLFNTRTWTRADGERLQELEERMDRIEATAPER